LGEYIAGVVDCAYFDSDWTVTSAVGQADLVPAEKDVKAVVQVNV